MACQCCDREASAGASLSLGVSEETGVEGLRGHQGRRQTDSPSLQPRSQHWREKGMRQEESHLLSFIRSQGIAGDVTPAHARLAANWKRFAAE